MKVKQSFIIFGLSLLVVLSACNQSSTIPTEPDNKIVGLANPASVFCIECGYELEIRKDEEGNEFGVCIFGNDTECEEWAFYRGECSPFEPADEVPDMVISARDAVLDFVAAEHPNENICSSHVWETFILSLDLVGSTSYEFRCDDWRVIVKYPVVAPDMMTFDVLVANPFRTIIWRFAVDANGVVTEK